MPCLDQRGPWRHLRPGGCGHLCGIRAAGQVAETCQRIHSCHCLHWLDCIDRHYSLDCLDCLDRLDCLDCLDSFNSLDNFDCLDFLDRLDFLDCPASLGCLDSTINISRFVLRSGRGRSSGKFEVGYNFLILLGSLFKPMLLHCTNCF